MKPVVKTRHGKARGSVADGVNTFKGIRYSTNRGSERKFLNLGSNCNLTIRPAR